MNPGRSEESRQDAMLVAEIESALSVDPSPEFKARVLSRVATERTGFMREWWHPAIVVAPLAIVIVLFLLVRAPTQPVPEDRQVRPFAPTEPETTAATSVAIAPAQRTHLRTTKIPDREPEVVFASTDLAAFQRLVMNGPVSGKWTMEPVMISQVIVVPSSLPEPSFTLPAFVPEKVETLSVETTEATEEGDLQ